MKSWSAILAMMQEIATIKYTINVARRVLEKNAEIKKAMVAWA